MWVMLTPARLEKPLDKSSVRLHRFEERQKHATFLLIAVAGSKRYRANAHAP